MITDTQDLIGIARGEETFAADRVTINRWRESARYYNQWRRDGVKAMEYFDGNQFDYELKQKYLERGLPLLYENCIRRWISTVVGQQANAQTDGRITVEDNRYEQFADAMSARLKEAERMSLADKACLTAFDSAVKVGCGWVEVGDPNDPFEYRHRAESISWREMWWDQTDRNPNLMNAEWFRRVKFYRRTDVVEAFPEFAELVTYAGTDSDPLTWAEQERYERQELYQRDPSQWSTWGTYDRDQLCVNEIRYRVWVRGYVFDGPGGVEVFDEANQQHMAAYQQGLITPRASRYRRARQSFWVGPHRLLDRWLNVPNGEIGWVPFFCHIEERTGTPYGLIRDMIPLQDEINTRKAKAAWAIDAHTIIADHDAVKNWDDARTQVNRRNGIILLDGDNKGARFEIDRHPGTTQENIELYESAKATIGYIHGLDAPFAGSPSNPGQSGIAQQTLIQQSIAALGIPLDNYRQSRKRVLNLLVDRLIAEIGGEPTTINYEHASGARKSVTLNVPVQIEDGTVETLSPRAIKTQLVLDETPSTTTYRQQQFLQIVDTMRSLPPQLQTVLAPAMIELSELPNRKMWAGIAKKLAGSAEPQNEQEAQQMQAAQQQAEQEKQAQLQLAQRAAEAKIAVDEAKAQQIQAQTQDSLQKMEALMQEILANVAAQQAAAAKSEADADKVKVETAAIAQDMEANSNAFAPPPESEHKPVSISFHW